MSKGQDVLIGTPILLVGGTEMQTLNLVRALVGAGYRVTVCCYYEHEAAMVNSMEEAGAGVVLMRLNRADGLWHFLIKLTRLLKKLSPQIIHIQYVAPGFVPIVAAWLAGVKKILATVHQPGRTHGWKARFILQVAARFCDLFFCVSRSAEESWFGDSALFDVELYKKGRQHFTIYNAVDAERIAMEAGSEHVAQLRSSFGLEGKRVVGYVGRLRWEKGPHILIDAFVNVVQEIPNVVLLIVGDGPDRNDLERRADKLGLAACIIWLGQKPQEEVFRVYGLMDVVAMPSFFEGFGLTAAEAMAAGVPVVGSAIDGLKEVIVDGETGHLTPPGMHKDLANALSSILGNTEKAIKMGKLGKEKVACNFSFSEYQKITLDAYIAIYGQSIAADLS